MQIQTLEDELLVARAAEGDDDAFAVLVHRHSGSLLALAYRMLGVLQDAEEIVQEAFTSAWRRLPEFRQDAAFRTWMYRIVTNRCLTCCADASPACRWTPSGNRRPAALVVSRRGPPRMRPSRRR